jgi:hypothetical protein
MAAQLPLEELIEVRFLAEQPLGYPLTRQTIELLTRPWWFESTYPSQCYSDQVRKLLSKQGFLALVAFLVWFTVIFARTHAFVDLVADPERLSAIVVAGLASGAFGVAIFRLYFNDDHDGE